MKVIECKWVDENWVESLIWAPSQLYRRIKCGEQVFTLYLRWRYEDPWRFFVARGDMLAEDDRAWDFVTEDLFERYNLFRRDNEYKIAEYEAQEIFYEELHGLLGLKGSTVVLVWSKEVMEMASKLYDEFMEIVNGVDNVVIVDDRNSVVPSVHSIGVPKEVFVKLVQWALGFVDKRLQLDFFARRY